MGNPMSVLKNTAIADLRVGSVISEAWEKSKNCRNDFILAAVLVVVALFVVIFIQGMITLAVGAEGLIASILSIIVGALFYTLVAGLMKMGIQAARGQEVSMGMAFGQFDKLISLFIAGFIVSLATTLGFFLLIIPGIFLTIALLLTVPILVDQGGSPIDAVKKSLFTVTKHWLSVALLFVVGMVAIFVGSIPFLIGLYWVLPAFYTGIGVVYTRLND
jgi:uncharacterized membrane protein